MLPAIFEAPLKDNKKNLKEDKKSELNFFSRFFKIFHFKLKSENEIF